MENEMFQEIITLVREGGTAAVWLCSVHYAVILLKIIVQFGIGFLAIKFVATKLSETIKHAWVSDIEIHKLKCEEYQLDTENWKAKRDID